MNYPLSLCRLLRFLWWRYLERVRVAVKEIEQANHCGDLHQFAVVKVRLQLIPQGLVNVAGAGGHDLGETQGRQFARRKQVPVSIDMVERVQQLFRHTK